MQEPITKLQKKIDETKLGLIKAVYDFQQDIQNLAGETEEALLARGSGRGLYSINKEYGSLEAFWDPIRVQNEKSFQDITDGLEFQALSAEKKFEFLMRFYEQNIRKIRSLKTEGGRDIAPDFNPMHDPNAPPGAAIIGDPSNLGMKKMSIAGGGIDPDEEDFQETSLGTNFLNRLKEWTENLKEKQKEIDPLVELINQSIDDLLAKFNEGEEELGNTEPVKEGIIEVPVEAGDTLSQLAVTYGTTVEKIKEMNKELFENNRLLQIGDKLKIDASAKLAKSDKATIDPVLKGEIVPETEEDQFKEALANYEQYAKAVEQINLTKNHTIEQQQLMKWEREHEMLKEALLAEQELQANHLADTYAARLLAGDVLFDDEKGRFITQEEEQLMLKGEYEAQLTEMSNRFATLRSDWKQKTQQLDVTNMSETQQALIKLSGQGGRIAQLQAIKDTIVNTHKGAQAAYAALA